MEIKLTNKESEDFFFNALCNGLNYMGGYGLELDYSEPAYITASAKLKHGTSDGSMQGIHGVCFEDVLMEILREGGSLTFIDREGEGDMTRSINLTNAHERVKNTPAEHLIAMVNETDDAETADCILQTVFFEEIIFG